MMLHLLPSVNAVKELCMKTVAVWAVVLVAWIAMPLAAQTKSSPVVMTVNDQPIYSWEVGLQVSTIQMELASRGGVQPKPEDVVNAAIRRVVESRLLAQEARRRNLKPDGTRVDQALADIEQQAGGREGLDAVLGRLGATYEQLRANAAESDVVQVFVKTQIEPQITVTPQEVSTFYDENPEVFERPEMVHAQHILIRISRQADQAEKDSAKARAVAARERIIAGEDFGDVAREVSEGREASEGGDLGFFARDSMVPAIANTAFALDVGEISEVVESQFGFHILKLLEKRAASKMTFAEAKGPAEQLLRENKSGERISKLLEELRQSANIVQMTSQSETPVE
jgi:peptidyl-prolyl cis-trans isomerase C